MGRPTWEQSLPVLGGLRGAAALLLPQPQVGVGPRTPIQATQCRSLRAQPVLEEAVPWCWRDPCPIHGTDLWVMQALGSRLHGVSGDKMCLKAKVPQALGQHRGSVTLGEH